jgi:hypothetical protein
MDIWHVKKQAAHRPPKPAEPAILNDAMPGAALVMEESVAPMVRTQVYLTRQEHDFLQAEGARRGEPMAAFIRSFIDEKMQVPPEAWENNPLLDPPADPGFVGPEDGAINLDHYIYGGPKKWIKQKGKWVEAPPLPEDYYSNPASAAVYDRTLREMDESAAPA